MQSKVNVLITLLGQQLLHRSTKSTIQSASRATPQNVGTAFSTIREGPSKLCKHIVHDTGRANSPDSVLIVRTCNSSSSTQAGHNTELSDAILKMDHRFFAQTATSCALLESKSNVLDLKTDFENRISIRNM